MHSLDRIDNLIIRSVPHFWIVNTELKCASLPGFTSADWG